MQMILIKRGSVETSDSPYKDFDKEFNEVLKLLHSHQTAYPKCNVEESEWDASVQELITAYESLPSHIVNPIFQPNSDSTRSPFAPTKLRSEIIKRNLFISPKAQATEREVEEVTEESSIVHKAATESCDNSNSAEMAELKERLLRTDVKKSREARGKVVDDIVANSESLVVEGPGNSNSEEMIKFKQRLLDTDDKKSKKEGARKKVVDYLKNNI